MHLKKAGEKVFKKLQVFLEGTRHFHKMHRHNTKKNPPKPIKIFIREIQAKSECEETQTFLSV